MISDIHIIRDAYIDGVTMQLITPIQTYIVATLESVELRLPLYIPSENHLRDLYVFASRFANFSRRRWINMSLLTDY